MFRLNRLVDAQASISLRAQMILGAMPCALIQREEGSEPRLAPARSRSPATSGTVYVVLYAVVPCLLRPIAMVLTIVVAFLVSLSVGARAPPVMNYLAFVCYAA